MEPRQLRLNGQYILYDAERLPQPTAALFDADALQRQGLWQGRPTGGRGSACFVTIEGIPAVLRRYRRGGIFAGLLKDRYLRGPLTASRPWREWWVLARLHSEGLPVPAPLAARMLPTGPCYRADIVMERLPAQTLAEALIEGRRVLSREWWWAIGSTVGRLHRRGLDHADLNAHNVLLSAAQDIGQGADRSAERGTEQSEGHAVYVIDLDRARLRRPQLHWQRRNLARLERSLRKLARTAPGMAALSAESLRCLTDGWSAGRSASQGRARSGAV
ncbi:3-deoxy-D-manno-octulosonic acid kinase [Halorhodospira abdelmalekii]|uniref:3-deoxy-D-manno-octulosonic acid kinase n=1 Tax=Halorhodospira abdelmalekii TaxID=421629 RepID=UPI001902C2D1|nr:3-deoxy-D-manno-octulosonic acid kinase [Halorhodospira abdelmalekii]MBK1734738.1 3-deoxy-D-manno-octulosonic acid kinase [Halorhodospira abdelmalekii]